jgi:endonuclease YncB( thermonuclease family)
MSALAALAAAALCVNVAVHDGDTIRCRGERIRLESIDAPELAGSPRCEAVNRKRLSGTRNPSWCDDAKGRAARDALRAFLASGPVMVHRHGKDVYGRTLARVTVNGRDAGAFLIQRGLARRWN